MRFHHCRSSNSSFTASLASAGRSPSVGTTTSMVEACEQPESCRNFFCPSASALHTSRVWPRQHLNTRSFSNTRLILQLAGTKTGDRKSTRLNSSHLVISYAVFCLKKKKH